MRKLIESCLVSLDGIVGAPEEWANFDEEDAALAHEELHKYDAFVMGRVTYERFYANWASLQGNPYIDLINSMPKYVASRSLSEAAWNATLLGADPAGAIARLKSNPARTSSSMGPAASTTRSYATTSSTNSAFGTDLWPSARDNGSSRT